MKQRVVWILLTAFAVSIVFLMPDLESDGARGARAAPHAAPHAASHAAPRAAPRQNTAARINRNMSRTPSMNQPISRPRVQPKPQPKSQPARKQAPQYHPQRQQVQKPSGVRSLPSKGATHNRPTQQGLKQYVQQHHAVTPQLQSRHEVSQFMQNRAQSKGAQSIPTVPHRLSKGQIPTNFTTNYRRQNQVNAQARVRVQHQVANRFPHSHNWFNSSFFESHDCQPFFFDHNVNWWAAPGWAGVCSWLPYGWQDPNYYYPDYYPGYGIGSDYPPASDLYLMLQADALSQGSTSVSAPPPDYYQGSDAGTYIAPMSVPQSAGSEQTSSAMANGDWLPLGVYSAGRSADEAGYSNMFVQLAIDKGGDIAGVYYNAATNETHELTGLVDQNSQEAVWKVSDKPDSPIMTTGLYNLTQDIATVRVNFPDGNIQTWVLVRLNQ